MKQDTLYITAEGLEKMKADLAALRQRRIVVATAIEHARSLGDLSENAEYHSAKEEQALVHAKIHDLEDKIARAVVLDNQERDTSKAFLGATVRAMNLNLNSETTFMLVGQAEADIMLGKISIQSPVGKSLLGRAVGEEVSAQTPAGPMKFKLLEINYE
ncbi:MAG: transcription elongation factor GreA [Candidatus Hydrogenedentes bacterium]|jgi:transcription elongation factor GreA|nr:transcription elongation factor GreA [Candidatus Hydrogenedentota bacterium]